MATAIIVIVISLVVVVIGKLYRVVESFRAATGPPVAAQVVPMA